ncbi:MAG: methyl-accepting chemotaxis protein, partial [Halobacteriota archaeon]|nr:methyl-accepting chemotaxis protein [Halobacteriota archaeon]
MDSGNFLVVVAVTMPILILIMSGFYLKYRISLLTKLLSIVFTVMTMTLFLGIWIGTSDFSMSVNILAIIAIFAFVALIGTVLGPIMIISPIKEVGKVMEEIAKTGDLSKRADVLTRDEVSVIVNSLNGMLDQIMDPIKALSEASNVVASGDLTHNIVFESKGDMNQLVNSFRLMVEKLREGKKLEDEVRNTDENTKKAKIEFAEKLMGKAQLFASNAEELSASSEDVTASSQEM